MLLIALPTVILEIIMSQALQDRTKSSSPTALVRKADLVLVHPRLAELVQALIWEDIDLHVSRGSKFATTLANLADDQRIIKLGSIRSLHIDAHGAFTRSPEYIRHVHLTKLSLRSLLPSDTFNELLEHVDVTRLRSIELEGSASSGTWQVHVFHKLLSRSAGTLEKLAIYGLQDHAMSLNNNAFPIFHRLRVVSFRNVFIKSAETSLCSAILAGAPQLQVLSLEGIARGARPSGRSSNPVNGVNAEGNIVASLLSVTSVQLKRLRLASKRARMPSGPFHFMDYIHAQDEMLQFDALWLFEMLDGIIATLSSDQSLPYLSRLSLIGPELQPQHARSWEVLKKLCQSRNIRLDAAESMEAAVRQHVVQ